MDDAISRSALVNDLKSIKFREEPFGDRAVDDLYQSIKDMHAATIYLVETATALDVAPVVHARWAEALGEGYTECTNCGFIPHSIDDKFCPNCGAKMDGDVDG